MLATEREEQQSATTVEVVRLVADLYPPYQFARDGGITGADYEIVVRSFAARGVETTIRLLPWEQCLRAIGCGDADAIFQIVRSPERECDLVFSTRFRTAKTLVFKRADLVVKPGQELPDLLAAHTVGVVRGFSYGLDVLDRSSGTIEVEKQQELLEGLSKRRFELALLDQGVAAYLIKELRVTGIEPIVGVQISRGLYVAARRGLAAVAKAFDDGFATLAASGDYDLILRSYGLSDWVSSGGDPGSDMVV